MEKVISVYLSSIHPYVIKGRPQRRNTGNAKVRFSNRAIHMPGFPTICNILLHHM